MRSIKQVITNNFKQKVFAKTGGIIGTYEWYEVRNEEGSTTRTFNKPKHKKDLVYHGKMPNMFMHPSKFYLIGEIDTAKYYMKHNMVVCNVCPTGVAIVLKKGYSYSGDIIGDEEIEGFFGYSTRGIAQMFKIGDKVFDSEWRGNYTEEEIKDIPYNQRGEHTIETWAQAEQAAINIAQYEPKK